jgi:hypothetical protein
MKTHSKGYDSHLVFNPPPSNPLFVLTAKIEDLLAPEPSQLALSALLSAAMHVATNCHCDGNRREAAEKLADAFKQIAESEPRASQ